MRDIDAFDMRVAERVRREKERTKRRARAKREARTRKRRNAFAALEFAVFLALGSVIGCAWNTYDAYAQARMIVEEYITEMRTYGHSAIEVDRWAWAWMRE